MASARSARARRPSDASDLAPLPSARARGDEGAPLALADRFFRDIVNSMRNGVLAVTRDGALAVINDEAYRIFALTPDPLDLGRPYAEVLRARSQRRQHEQGCDQDKQSITHKPSLRARPAPR